MWFDWLLGFAGFGLVLDLFLCWVFVIGCWKLGFFEFGVLQLVAFFY